MEPAEERPASAVVPRHENFPETSSRSSRDLGAMILAYQAGVTERWTRPPILVQRRGADRS